MERITIDVTRDELNFIREAVEYKINSLKNYFKDCESAANAVSTVTVTKGEASATVKIPVPWDKPEAPYGLKKDGTPRARPGRKSARKGRA